MDFVVREGDMVLVDVIPLLYADLLWAGACLSCYQLLQVADSVVLAAKPEQSSETATLLLAKLQ